MNTHRSDLWSYLRTRFTAGERDAVLCVGANLPCEIIGHVRSVTSFAQMPDDCFDLIFGQNQLNQMYTQKEHFQKIHERLKENGMYALAEPITAFEDAWLNTLLATVNPQHVRSPRAEEVIACAAEYLALVEFLRFDTVAGLPLTDEKMAAEVKKQIESMPDHIIQTLAPTMTEAEVKWNMPTGLFVWQR